MTRETDAKSCSCSLGACAPPTRREFLQVAGLAAAAAWFGPEAAVAGPFEVADFEKLVPRDKKLTPEWVKSLFERGVPAVYRGEELRHVGMPVGGICAGQLYLGGDGRLWHWDLFNQQIHTGSEHYANPMVPASPVEQGLALKVTSGGKTEVRALDGSGFQEVTFRGEYPIGIVDYRDPALPVSVRLEAFSPFIPLSAEDSSLPATLLEVTVKNLGATQVECELAGWLENAVCLHSGQPKPVSQVLKPAANLTFLEHSVQARTESEEKTSRPDILFEDFEKETYEGWTAAGTAFGSGPVEMRKMAAYQGDVGGRGKRVVNTHNVRQGEDVLRGDAHLGTLTSKPFVIERNFIKFLIGGGAHQGRTCMNLLVEGQVVRSATGANDNRMKPAAFDVRSWAGRKAQLQIVDQEGGGWGNIGIDEIVFSDTPAQPELPLPERLDFGTMGLAWLGPQEGVTAIASIGAGKLPEAAFAPAGDVPRPKPVGALVHRFALVPGQQETFTLAIAWHFPNLRLPRGLSGRHYAARFTSAGDVAVHLAKNHQALAAQTRLWRDTWYDSTLPYWLLDRTLANASILATSTCHWLPGGRFYGWEGVGCCEGTCTHVWHYAHAMARLFPQLERAARELTDFGIAFDPETGLIGFRGEAHRHAAIDGQAGCILRAYREHQMSADAGFLKRIWPKVRKALEFLIRADGDSDGLIEGQQHNTLDADWFGPIAWLSGLYLAALAAGEQMAREMGDEPFAKQARAVFDVGRQRIVERLWSGEYFINRPDPKHLIAINSGTGCHIDQVFGQSWAFQVGLERVFSEEHARAALRALWKYNFTPDVGPYRAAMKAGRWYAMPGEGGLIMCTFPRTDWSFEDAQGKGNTNPGFAGYFNECMNGFEYQVAGHLLWEGMLQEGLAITRMIHDRYHPLRRNPFNEVECGDHYARSMASYGVFLAACGYEYHGPRGHLGFAPRLGPEDFRAAFTSAEGWGTISQKRQPGGQTAAIHVRWGTLRLRSVALQRLPGVRGDRVTVLAGGKPVAAQAQRSGDRLLITLAEEVAIPVGGHLEIQLA